MSPSAAPGLAKSGEFSLRLIRPKQSAQAASKCISQAYTPPGAPHHPRNRGHWQCQINTNREVKPRPRKLAVGQIKVIANQIDTTDKCRLLINQCQFSMEPAPGIRHPPLHPRPIKLNLYPVLSQ
jgi:hypothetical protein